MPRKRSTPPTPSPATSVTPLDGTSAITPADAGTITDTPTPLRASRLRNSRPLSPAAREQAQELFLATFAATGNVSAACAKAMINRDTAYTWREKDDLFAKAWLTAEEDAADVLRMAAHRRAVFGWDVPLVSMGKVVTDARGNPLMERKYSDGLLGSMLKAHAPEYRDRREVELTGAGGGPLEINQRVMFLMPQVEDEAPAPPFVDALPPAPAGKDTVHAQPKHTQRRRRSPRSS